MLEHGAYTLLLDHYYATGKPIEVSNASLMPDHSRVYRLCSAATKEEKEAVDAVLEMFFQLTDQGYINAKASAVIEQQRAAHERRVNAGRKGGKNSSSNAKAMPQQSPRKPEPEPDISLSKDKESSGKPDTLPSTLCMNDGRFLSPDQFCQELWELYPSVGRGKGHKGKFCDYIKKALKKGIKHEEIKRGVTRYAEYCESTGELNKDAFRWARDAEWENDYTISAAAHKPQQGRVQREKAGGLAQVIDAGEKAKEAVRREDEAGS